MEFQLTEEQLAIQDSLRRFLAKDYSFERRKAIAASDEGLSREAWKTYADMGLLALPIAEADGGLGGNPVDTMLVMELLGAAMTLEPYLATAITGATLLREGAAAAERRELLGAVAGGELMLAMAHLEPGRRYAPQQVATHAVRDGEGWRLSGRKSVVIGAPQAGRLLVTARTAGAAGDAGGVSLFLVDPQAAGLTMRRYANHDAQRAADLTLDGVRAEALLGERDGAMPAVTRAIEETIAALCAEAAGIMGALNTATLEYLKTRKQFGVTIGSFQALQHRMADMTIAGEQAKSMATLAAVKVQSADAAERARVVSAAKAYVGQQARFVGQQAIQLHGGMGLTTEMNVGHLFKRLTLITLAYGDTDHHFGRFSDTLLAA